MIHVHRGPEPARLREARMKTLPELVRIARLRAFTPADFQGYKVVADDLWHGQGFKCCYCERKIPRSYNDVEHYRPKASATRHPGSVDTHGYWWLAFTWENLLFACPTCNRSGKNDQFPLDKGSVALVAQHAPPGKELPLFLDPAAENGVPHIEFVFSVIASKTPAQRGSEGWAGRKHWWPRARSGSLKGDWTIRVCELDQQEFVELYDDHVNKEVRPVTADLLEAIRRRQDVSAPFDRALRLLQPGKAFVGLSYDALRLLVPAGALAPCNLAWPEPEHVGRTPQPKRRRSRA
jgi:hypothetical protein